MILRRFEVIFKCLEWECCTFWKIDGDSFKSTNTTCFKDFSWICGWCRPLCVSSASVQLWRICMCYLANCKVILHSLHTYLYIFNLCISFTIHHVHVQYKSKETPQLIGLFSPNLVITNFMQCFLYGPIG